MGSEKIKAGRTLGHETANEGNRVRRKISMNVNSKYQHTGEIMRMRVICVLLAVMLATTAGVFAVEDGLGTNHVRNLRATEDVVVDGGDVTIGEGDVAKAGTIVLHDADAGDANTATLEANADLAASYTLTLPGDDGDTDQVLTTDGSGALSWSSPSANAASKALDNLATVAINADLDPGADDSG